MYQTEKIQAQENLTFTHCRIQKGFESHMTEIFNKISANFYTIEIFSPIVFVHLIDCKNSQSINKSGLITKSGTKILEERIKREFDEN